MPNFHPPVTPDDAASNGKAPGERARHELEGVVRFAACEINVATRQLFRAGVQVPIRRQVLDLLLLLIQRQPQTVSRDELRHLIWGRQQLASSAIARAVLEARRAIGDTEEAAQLIVNVHGVGYRFAGPLTASTTAAQARPASPRAAARSHLQEAAAAYEQRNDGVRARFYAEQALSEALRHGLTTETGHALCWLGWLALEAGATEEAAGHIGHALHLAAREENAGLLARARLGDAMLRLCFGGMCQAMQLLTEAHPVLEKAGATGDRYRCEKLLSTAARRLGDHSGARRWCLKAQRTAKGAGMQLAWLQASGDEAVLLMEAGDRCERERQTDAAQQAWQEALAISTALLSQLDPTLDPWLHSDAMVTRGLLIGRLGRLAEARDAQLAIEQFLDKQPNQKSPAVVERRVVLQMDRGRQSLREGDEARALCDLQTGIERAQALGYQGPCVPALYELASTVAERCGKVELALRWSRAHHAAHLALEGERASALMQVIQARSQYQALAEKFKAAQEQIHYLERMNAELLRRVPPGGAPAAPPTLPV